jgi:hypothetical protein
MIYIAHKTRPRPSNVLLAGRTFGAKWGGVLAEIGAKWGVHRTQNKPSPSNVLPASTFCPNFCLSHSLICESHPTLFLSTSRLSSSLSLSLTQTHTRDTAACMRLVSKKKYLEVRDERATSVNFFLSCFYKKNIILVPM